MKKFQLCELLESATSHLTPLSLVVPFTFLAYSYNGWEGQGSTLSPPLDDLTSSQELSGFKGSAFVTVLVQLAKIMVFYTLTKPTLYSSFKWVDVDVKHRLSSRIGIRRGARWHQSGRAERGKRRGRAKMQFTSHLALTSLSGGSS